MRNLVLALSAVIVSACGSAAPTSVQPDDLTMVNIRQDPQTMETIDVVNRFNEAFNRHDVDAIMAAMTDDCVFENTRPAPDGERVEGQAAVRAVWTRLFERSPQARFTTEEMFAAGDRAVVRWRYDWIRDGVTGHVRGVDVFRIRDGKVAEKLSYVKG